MATDPTINPATDPDLPQPAQEETTPPTEQDVIDAETDPEVRMQMYAAQAATDQEEQSPTEQDVIDAETDPEVRMQMYAAQAASGEGETPSPTEQDVLSATNTASSVDKVRQAGAISTAGNLKQQEDWRLRLSLAPTASYLYKDPKCKQGHLLWPLVTTGGVIFPYTPQIQMSYKANYDPSDIAHTNYKQYFYRNSSVEEISINADFTAQDTTEALYLLAVIHFFRSVTKMFYGQDPLAGTPPPLCYLSGLGRYQFNNHPVVITNFAYNLPNDVDYIRAGSTTQYAGQNVGAYGDKARGYTGIMQLGLDRLFGNGLKKGGMSTQPDFNGLSNSQSNYVPTKISIQLGMLPVVTRYNISTQFTNSKYASGEDYAKGIW